MPLSQEPGLLSEARLNRKTKEVKNVFIKYAIGQALGQFRESFFNTRGTSFTHRRVVSSTLINITMDRIRCAGGASVTLPVGQRVRVESPAPLTGLVLVAVEDSGMITDEDLTRIKAAVMDNPKYYKVGILGLSTESDVFEGSFSFFLEGQTHPSRFGMRKRTATTFAWHRVLFEFDTILENKTHPMYKHLAQTLGESGLSDISVELISELYEGGKVGMIIVTDGLLQGVDILEFEYQKYKEYLEKFRKGNLHSVKAPLTYISITEHMNDPIKIDSDQFYRVLTRAPASSRS